MGLLLKNILNMGGANRAPHARGARPNRHAWGATRQSAAKTGATVGVTSSKLTACAHSVSTARAKKMAQFLIMQSLHRKRVRPHLQARALP